MFAWLRLRMPVWTWLQFIKFCSSSGFLPLSGRGQTRWTLHSMKGERYKRSTNDYMAWTIWRGIQILNLPDWLLLQEGTRELHLCQANEAQYLVLLLHRTDQECGWVGDHEKEACAKRHGATHIHAHLTSGGESIRKAEERDLILRWQPPCNEQLVDWLRRNSQRIW